MGRVAFISIGGKSQRGEEKRTMDIFDSSLAKNARVKVTVIGKTNASAVKDVHINDVVKLGGLRCTLFQEDKSLIVNEKDSLHVSVVDETNPLYGSVPEREPPQVSALEHLSLMDGGTVSLLVKVEQVLEGNILVIDHTGTSGSVHIGGAADTSMFRQDAFLCLHKVSVWKGRATMWESGGMEEVDEADFWVKEGGALQQEKDEASMAGDTVKEEKDDDSEHEKK